MSRARRVIRRHCTIPVTAYSWWPARPSVAASSFAPSCCQTKATGPGALPGLGFGEHTLERCQQAPENAVHLGRDLGGNVGRSQFGGEQIGGALADVGEHGLRSPPPIALRGLADAAQPQRLELDGGKLRIGVITQSGKQRQRGAVDGLVV